MEEDDLSLEIMKSLAATVNEDGKGSMSSGDLFSAHDFDIKLDLDAKLPRKYSLLITV